MTVDHFGLLDLLPFIAVGFAAQLVDGALGMAFGVISTTLLTDCSEAPRSTLSAPILQADVAPVVRTVICPSPRERQS